MAAIITVENTDDPRLDVYARLTEAQLRSKRAPAKGLFIAESGKVILHALEAGYEPVSLLMAEHHLTGQGAEIMEKCGDIPVYIGSDATLESLTGYRLTRGVLCAMRRRPLPEEETLVKSAGRIAVLEGVSDSTNIGAIFRSAAALGMDAILLEGGCCDPLCRRSVRVSMGTVFQVPWTRTRGDTVSTLDALKAAGFVTAAMALDSRAISVEDEALKGKERLAVVLGAEGDGLKRDTMAACDCTVMIPMFRGVDSLNVAAASAVAFWEMRRR